MDVNKQINPWLSVDFYDKMKFSSLKNVKVIYGCFTFENEVRSYFPMYLYDFSLENSLQEKNIVKKYLGKLIRVKLLVMGQFFATGSNYPFSEKVGDISFHVELDKFLQKVASLYRAKAILWKDFFTNCPALEQHGYFPFKYQPTMLFKIPADWETMQHYEQSLSSKYRVRLYRARNKMKDITWRILNPEDIISAQADLHQLYLGVLNQATFNMTTVPASYFPVMKEIFNDRYNITAGYLNGKMVCFYSTLMNGNILEANLAGFEEHTNNKMQLYLNMLFLMVEEAIQLKVETLNFYRTAMEIKSSVGAVGMDTMIYVKPTSKWLAPLFPIFIPWFSPQNPVWKARSPFKSILP
jgi:hypothetical protein